MEFARIFGFEVDFQRDIRKGDWFEILYERFEDDNDIVEHWKDNLRINVC